MVEQENQPENSGFQSAVKKHVGPLVECFGFRLEQESILFVTYRSGRVELRLRLLPFSYEIEVIIRLLEGGQAFGLLDVLQLSLGDDAPEHLLFQASSPERVNRCVESIAGLLREHGRAVLDGQQEAFNAMRSLSRSRNERYTRHIVEEPVRKKAEQAWREADYSRVVDLYRSLKPNLSAIEAKRLDYAERHRS